MIQTRLENNNAKPKYSYGAYNKYNDVEQWVRITEGCPHNCPYCYEPQEFKYFEIPNIVRNKVKIMDMNLLAKPKAKEIITELSQKRVNGKVIYYELICGVDYRFLTLDMAKLLKQSRFKNIRLAWDWGINRQLKVKNAVRDLVKAGYDPAREIMVFMICNWRIPFSECMRKLDILKVWRVKVADCYYDNQTAPNIVPKYWSDEEIKIFRKTCRRHNQIVIHGLEPELLK